jgi:hypothetical protein
LTPRITEKKPSGNLLDHILFRPLWSLKNIVVDAKPSVERGGRG